MSAIIDVERGSYKEVIAAEGPYIEWELTFPNTGWLLVDFKLREQEKNSIVQCFNNANHIYAFGHDPEGSGFAVSYLVFLGERCMNFGEFNKSSTLNSIMQQYFEKRISVRKNTITLTHNRTTHDVIVLGLDVSVSDIEMHTVSLTISGKCVGHD